MKILAYKGKGLISRLIQFQTRSPYSHVALLLNESEVIEAWHVGGVRKLATPFVGHDLKTVIDVYNITEDFDEETVLKFLQKQLGKSYDFRSVFRFLTREKVVNDDKWFCSELICEAFSKGGLPLLKNISCSMVSPRDVSISPYLEFEREITASSF